MNALLFLRFIYGAYRLKTSCVPLRDESVSSTKFSRIYENTTRMNDLSDGGGWVGGRDTHTHTISKIKSEM